jgi:hypothetical protein
MQYDRQAQLFQPNSSVPQMEAAGSSETAVGIFQTTKQNIPDSHHSAYVDQITNISSTENEEHQIIVNGEQAVIVNTQLCML